MKGNKKGFYSSKKTTWAHCRMTKNMEKARELTAFFILVFSECTLSNVADNTKLEGVADMTDGCTATQRDPGMLEKWAKRNLMKFKGKCEEEDMGNYRLITLTSILEKVVEQVLLEVISEHMWDKKMTGNNQHGFMTQGKLRLTNLIAFCDRMTGSADNQRAVDVIFFGFSKAFDMFCYHIYTQPEKHGLSKWTRKGVKNGLD
ncbi:hypothetical protein QYF61_012828 [Mycteria americana]|uniref:Reverse transcriptase domain-containing protein n=1 Tax=Mycteria americana TaxID=33587 RepID=A0AAN7SC91_MYCAM|nr:hypothetical protein QYF61_012828 [Mycteria americana]